MSTALKLYDINYLEVQSIAQEQNILNRFPDAPHERATSSYKLIVSDWLVACIIKAAKAKGFDLYVKSYSKLNSKQNKGLHFIVLGTNVFYGEGKNRAEITITLRNSADALNALTLFAGCMVLVCLNGLHANLPIVPSARVVHKGLCFERIEAAVEAVFSKLDVFRQFCERLQTTHLTNEQMSKFHTEALKIRGINDLSPEFTTIDKARRVEDLGTTAWAVFNRVQENLTKGFTAIQGDKIKQIQALRSPKSDFDMNVKLMDAIYKIVA